VECDVSCDQREVINTPCARLGLSHGTRGLHGRARFCSLLTVDIPNLGRREHARLLLPVVAATSLPAHAHCSSHRCTSLRKVPQPPSYCQVLGHRTGPRRVATSQLERRHRPLNPKTLGAPQLRPPHPRVHRFKMEFTICVSPASRDIEYGALRACTPCLRA
jgi:hypothetical protein